MTGLGDIVLLRPHWLLAVPVIVALTFWRMRRVGYPGDWQARIAPEMMQALAALGRVEKARSPLAAALPFMAAALVSVALSGPAVERRGAQTFRNLDGVVFVVDVSGSMTQDAAWSGAVNMMRAGLSVLGSKPAALVVFAGDAYVAAPLSTDLLQLGQTVSLLDEETVPDRGNRPALGLEAAADMLAQAEIIAGDVMLVSDGGGLNPEALRAAERIAGLGGRLSVVFAPTTVSGNRSADRTLAETLAKVGGGKVYGIDDVARFMGDLGHTDTARLERQDLKLLLLADYGRYLLLFALLPVLTLFRREQT